MSVTKIVALLDELARSERLWEEVENEKAALIRAAIPSDVQERIDAIDAEFTTKIRVVSDAVQSLKGAIAPLVIAFGKSVRGRTKMAVFVKGRETWNLDAVTGFLRAHKARLSDFMVVKPATIQIRNCGKDESDG